MSHLLQTKVGMMAVLAAIAVFFTWRLMARSRDPSSLVNLDDLLVDDVTGKISKAAAVMMGSFGVTSWIVVYQALTDKLSDTTFAAYVGAWVIPAVTKLITNRPQSPQTSAPKAA
jgi:hypothetical protein